MNLKPYYKLTDFVDLKDFPGRQNYEAQCPCCKKHHLSISKKTGLFHCFTPECNFNGICDEFRREKSEEGRGKNESPISGIASHAADNSSLSTLPSSLSTLPSSLIRHTVPESYVPLDIKLSSIKSNPAVIKYLADQQIPLEVAEQAGCMSAVRNIDGIAYNCLCYVNRLYGSIINVKYRAVTEKKFTQDVQPKDKNVPSAPYNIEALNPLRIREEGRVKN